MRRLIALASVLALIALAPAGCRIRKKSARRAPAEEDGQLASVVNVADPRASVQLTQGFYSVESDAWRWTAKNFSVALRPPKGADQKGMTLQLSFVLPEVSLNRLGPMTVSGRANGVDLGSETFSKSGELSYHRDVPPNALTGEVVVVDFSLDKALPPTPQDQRELGIVVSAIGLVAK